MVEVSRMTENAQVDVAVVGAGPVGAALACRLAHGGVRVAVIDRAALPAMEHPAFDGRAYAIAAGNRGFLEAAGVWERLPFAPCPIREIRVSDGRPGRPPASCFLHFDHRAAGAGPFGWIVEARSLRLALNAQLAATPGLAVFAPAEARVSRHAEGVDIAIVGGPRLAARLVVAAEGRASPLRTAAGIPVTRFPYRQSGLVAAIAHERAHRFVALEHFLPGGPFAQLPMSGTAEAAHVSGIVFTEKTAEAARLHGLSDAGFTAEVARRLGDHLGAIRLVGRRWCYPLAALHAHRYFDTRLALVGDSAHGVHPIAGQGLNLGFRDAAALAGLILSGGDPGSTEVLRAYQAARRGPNLLMLAATDTLDRLFSNDHPAIRLARDLGIAAVHRAPRLKRFFIRQAMG